MVYRHDLARSLHNLGTVLDDLGRPGESEAALRRALDLRTKLADLRGSLQGNDKLEAMLQETMKDADKMAQLKSELGPSGGKDV